MSDSEPMDEILGVAFGDIAPELGGVLVSLLVRTTRDGKQVEGVRDPLLMHREVLTTLRNQLPVFLDAVRESGIKSDAIRPAAKPIPWNAGPSMAQAVSTGLFMCAAFGFYAPESDHLAPLAHVEVASGLSPDEEASGVDYIFALPSLVEFYESIPKVLRKMDQKGVIGLGALH